MGVSWPPSELLARFSTELVAEEMAFICNEVGGVGWADDLRGGFGGSCDISGSYAKLSILLD